MLLFVCLFFSSSSAMVLQHFYDHVLPVNSVSEQLNLYEMRMKPHAYSPNWRDVSPLFVQHLTQNMLDTGGPTSIVATVGTGFRFALSQKVPRLSAIAVRDIEILVTSKNEPSHSAQNGGVSSSEMPALT